MSASLPESIDIDVLFRFANGTATSDERRDVERWMADAPAHRERVETLARMWALTDGISVSPGNTKAVWGRLVARMEGEKTVAVVGERLAVKPLVLTPVSSRSGRVLRSTARIAVAAMLGGVIVLGAWQYHARQAAPKAAEQSIASDYRTVRGQRATVMLVDGTHIQLGVDSKLRVHMRPDGRRDVELEGTAIFDVTHDARRPFTVRTGDLVTEDLGTRFAIRAYAGEASVRVGVASGQVALRHVGERERGAVLNPGDVGRVMHAGAIDVRNNADLSELFGWSQGQLVLRQETLDDAALMLERWFAVRVSIRGDTNRMRRVTVNMPLQSLDDVLQAITRPLGLAYTHRGQQVMIFTQERGGVE